MSRQPWGNGVCIAPLNRIFCSLAKHGGPEGHLRVDHLFNQWAVFCQTFAQVWSKSPGPFGEGHGGVLFPRQKRASFRSPHVGKYPGWFPLARQARRMAGSLCGRCFGTPSSSACPTRPRSRWRLLWKGGVELDYMALKGELLSHVTFAF